MTFVEQWLLLGHFPTAPEEPARRATMSEQQQDRQQREADWPDPFAADPPTPLSEADREALGDALAADRRARDEWELGDEELI